MDTRAASGSPAKKRLRRQPNALYCSLAPGATARTDGCAAHSRRSGSEPRAARGQNHGGAHPAAGHSSRGLQSQGLANDWTRDVCSPVAHASPGWANVPQSTCHRGRATEYLPQWTSIGSSGGARLADFPIEQSATFRLVVKPQHCVQTEPSHLSYLLGRERFSCADG
jgi:hypothetical protein